MLRSIFYLTGAIFFIIVIVACIMFMIRTSQTAKQIKKVIKSTELDGMIQKLTSSFRTLNRL